jgi:hypothetical protein
MRVHEPGNGRAEPQPEPWGLRAPAQLASPAGAVKIIALFALPLVAWLPACSELHPFPIE